MEFDDLCQAQARWRLGLLHPEQLPELACEALESGLDSPSLRVLAGEIEPTRDAAQPLFERALRELGIPAVAENEAVLIVAKTWATRIVEQSISPYEGAKGIWDECCDLRGPSSSLDIFLTLASEHEDYRFANSESPHRYDEKIREAENAIVYEARRLLGLGSA